MTRSAQVEHYLGLLCIAGYIKHRNYRHNNYIDVYVAKAIYGLVLRFRVTYYPYMIGRKCREQAEHLFGQLTPNKIDRLAMRSEHFFEFIQYAIDAGIIVLKS